MVPVSSKFSKIIGFSGKLTIGRLTPTCIAPPTRTVHDGANLNLIVPACVGVTLKIVTVGVL